MSGRTGSTGQDNFGNPYTVTSSGTNSQVALYVPRLCSPRLGVLTSNAFDFPLDARRAIAMTTATSEVAAPTAIPTTIAIPTAPTIIVTLMDRS
ncbi:hypothetical protein FRC03_006555, partial [Tulasnella sp. 419]